MRLLFYVLTVDQLAKKLGIEIAEPKDRKKKVASITEKDEYLPEIYQFQFLFCERRS